MTKMLIGTEKDYNDLVIRIKKEVFDDIDKIIELGSFYQRINLYGKSKKRHLPTLPEAKRHNSSFTTDCLNFGKTRLCKNKNCNSQIQTRCGDYRSPS